jgi:hypothetical protein
MTIGVDAHRFHEDDRIRLIGASVMGQPTSSTDRPVMNGFIVEDEAKADRYVRKLQGMFPGIRIVDRQPGPTPNTILIRVAGPLR